MDDLLDFGQLGVDQLYVDEAHMFKNLMYVTKMQNVRRLGNAKGSQKAYDMFIKTHQLYEKNGGGRGVVFTLPAHQLAITWLRCTTCCAIWLRKH